MDVPTITMDQEQAAEKQLEYEAVLKKSYPNTTDGRRQRELDEAAALGFEALAEGKRVLNLHTALSHGSLFLEGESRGLPRLAFARADATRVEYRMFSGREVRFVSKFTTWSSRKNSTFSFSDLAWNYELALSAFKGRYEYTAIVPSIPPNIRPRGLNLAHHHILWEADWKRAPVDPFLLCHLAGQLYTVEAEWDLTDLERGLLDAAMVRS